LKDRPILELLSQTRQQFKALLTREGSKALGGCVTMPLYDIVCLFKAAASRREIVEIMTSVGKRIYARNGVVTDINSYGMQPLGYQIKRQGTRFDEVSNSSACPLSAQ
jgi:ribosomal protein S6